MSSTDLVKSAISSGRSAKVIMKNSSCGFAVLKNSMTASRALVILSFMLPLMSKITPREMGASSLATCCTSCTWLPSLTAKFSFSRPVTIRFQSSVTVTLTSTRSTNFWIGLPWTLNPPSGAGLLSVGFLSSFGWAAGSVFSLGWIWTFTSWATVLAASMNTHNAATIERSACTQ